MKPQPIPMLIPSQGLAPRPTPHRTPPPSGQAHPHSPDDTVVMFPTFPSSIPSAAKTLVQWGGLSDAQAQGILEGTPVTLWTDAQPTQRVDATITRTTRALDARTRTLECEIELANPGSEFTPGDSVHVNLIAASPSTLAVPVEAVYLRQGRTSVMTIHDGRAVRTSVDVGDNDGKKVRVLSGLHEGDKVVLHAGGDIAEGSFVEAVREMPPQATARH
jgi:multidrug efflux pump subunit AcrA (membrane-fusion protein)